MILQYQIHREVMKRGKPIWFYALNQRELDYSYDVVRCIMDTRGNITPTLWRPYRGWGNEVIYYPNYWFAWAQKLRLGKSAWYELADPY